MLWLVDDVTHVRELRALNPILLWHDRSMLPLLRLPAQQAAYHELLGYMVQPGQGWVLLSVPRPGGPTHLGDLPLQPYTLEALVTFLGPDYALQCHRPYEHRLPDGTRLPSLYALFKRQQQPATPFRTAP